jgi:hypothetical protein
MHFGPSVILPLFEGSNSCLLDSDSVKLASRGL